ncbi:Phage regulatory protein Rha [compost metagenome]|jgi:phage regulator Rha-like protein
MNSPATTISPQQAVSRMSSREIADLTDKAHKHVLADIRKMLKELNIDWADFSAQYQDDSGRTLPCFSLDRELTDILLSGYSVLMRQAVIRRWHELEAQVAPMPTHIEALRLYADQLEQTQRVTAERDKAIATKALIGSRREATAMATASAAKREAAQLKEELGRGVKHATIAAVEKALGRPPDTFSFVPLCAWCKKHDEKELRVDNLGDGFVLAWPAGAWMAAHKVDLVELFGAKESAA